jgi:hypothetical protein
MLYQLKMIGTFLFIFCTALVSLSIHEILQCDVDSEAILSCSLTQGSVGYANQGASHKALRSQMGPL